MKELVEVIAKSLVEHPDEVVVTENEKDHRTESRTFRHGKGHRKTGTYCQGNPYCSKSGFFKEQQKSNCRHSAIKRIGAVET